jgi:SAM-dependent methyltransferase
MSLGKLITPPQPRPIIFYLVGLAILMLNKLRYQIRGYREPRPFDPSNYTQAIDYDRRVVKNWIDALYEYNGQSVEGKTILELGPGADLGNALILLNAGASRYVTVDANRLIDQTPPIFYTNLLQTLVHGQELKNELQKTLSGNDGRIRYHVDPSFSLSVLRDEQFDIVVSQAAFEHFTDVDKTIEHLSVVSKPGTVFIAEVDGMTHTGIMRSRDPLNLYRYSDCIYKLLRFSGIPNRLRPKDYRTLLEHHGWDKIEIIPLQQLPSEYVEKIRPRLARRFRGKDADMSVLTFLIRATKK